MNFFEKQRQMRVCSVPDTAGSHTKMDVETTRDAAATGGSGGASPLSTSNKKKKSFSPLAMLKRGRERFEDMFHIKKKNKETRKHDSPVATSATASMSSPRPPRREEPNKTIASDTVERLEARVEHIDKKQITGLPQTSEAAAHVHQIAVQEAAKAMDPKSSVNLDAQHLVNRTDEAIHQLSLSPPTPNKRTAPPPSGNQGDTVQKLVQDSMVETM